MHLFVYGTLRGQTGHPMHERLRAHASFEGEARVRGRLYLIADYPGLVLDERAGWVTGELYQLHTRQILGALDAYEGAGPEDPEPREYQRIRGAVQRLDGRECSAWIYEYRGSIDGRPAITSGDFLAP